MQSTSAGGRHSIAADLLLLTVLIGAVYLALLGHRPLAVPSEARYAEIPREMLATGDWLTPRLNGVKYFEKPPLMYWLVALSEAAFGRSEFAVRLPTAAFGLGGCLLVYVAARRLWTRRAGLLAAGTLATALLYFELSRQTLLDMPVAVFLTGASLAFLLGIRAPPGSPARVRAMYLMYAAAALATMTKGLIGIVLPGLVVFTWLLITARWAELCHVRLVSGTVLFLAIAAPWHVVVGLANPEFFWFYFVHEHVLRFVTPEAGRNQPAWFFVPILIAGWLPWCVFLPSAVLDSVRRWRAGNADDLFILLWFALPFLFFSASHSKLIPYALPFFPPLALLLGAWLDTALTEASQSLKRGFVALAILLMVVAAAGMWLDISPETFIAARHLAEAAPAFPYLPGLAAGFVAVAAIVGWTGWRGQTHAAVAIVLVAAAAFGLVADRITGEVQPRSTKPFIAMLEARLKPGDEVASLYAYYQDLPFYLDRLVTVAGAGGGELDFGRSVEDVSGWMIDENEFWRRWRRPDRAMYAVVPLPRYEALPGDRRAATVELARTRSDVLIANRSPGQTGESPNIVSALQP
ncbi:MAG TPA: phospholipid carrier-dependent glycosyltransferase [Alphaproteobacteria bacterium]